MIVFCLPNLAEKLTNLYKREHLFSSFCICLFHLKINIAPFETESKTNPKKKKSIEFKISSFILFYFFFETRGSSSKRKTKSHLIKVSESIETACRSGEATRERVMRKFYKTMMSCSKVKPVFFISVVRARSCLKVAAGIIAYRSRRMPPTCKYAFPILHKFSELFTRMSPVKLSCIL